MRRTLLLYPLVFATLGWVGCDRTHMSDLYGRDVRRALRAQIIDPKAGSQAKMVEGLDPEEAGIVLKTYRMSLSPNKEAAADQKSSVIVLPPNAPNVAPPQNGGQ